MPASASNLGGSGGARTAACRVHTHVNARLYFAIIFLLLTTAACFLLAQPPRPLFGQSDSDIARKSAGCIACHGQTDSSSMHPTGTVHLGCTDCHGGKADVNPPQGAQKGSSTYDQAKKQAHPQPRNPDLWKTSANPIRPYTKWLEES